MTEQQAGVTAVSQGELQQPEAPETPWAVSPSEPPEGYNSAEALISGFLDSGFLASRTVNNRFLLF